MSIGLDIEGLEYHTRDGKTVNAPFKSPVKLQARLEGASARPGVASPRLRYSRAACRTSDDSDDGLRARISRQGEDTFGRIAQELLESPLVSGALSRAFEAREKAAQAQEVAMGALNLPSAGDLERLTRRVRSVSQRLEGVEDALDRVEQRISSGGGVAALDGRLEAIEQQLGALASQLAELAGQAAPAPVAPVAPAAPRTPTRARQAAAAKRAAAAKKP